MTITIAGTVYQQQDGHRQPVADATVIAESVQGEPHVIIEQQTDANGAYKLADLKVGRWRLSARTKGWALHEPVVADFAQDTVNQNLEMVPALTTAGTAYWYGSNERVRGAVVKATHALHRKVRFATTDDDGDFVLVGMESGQWTIIVMGEESHPTQPTVMELADDQYNLRFDLYRLEGTPDEATGQRLFYTLLAVLGVLLAIYVLLHWWLTTPSDGNVVVSYFWANEPLKYVEVLLWGLAGVLVSKIIEIGNYLRWRRFYREGLMMHIAQVATVPLLALVTALLLAQIKLSFSLADSSEISLDLSLPTILVTVAFIIGTVPWKVWNFVQTAATQVTERISGPRATAQPSKIGAGTA